MKNIIITAGIGLLLSGCTVLEQSGDIKREYMVLNASWYSQGKVTASGEKFRPEEVSVAHRTYPFGTVLKMTNPVTGATVVAKVNDRGPFIKGRSLDVSKGAARQLGMIEIGCMPLHVEVVSLPPMYMPIDLTTMQLEKIERVSAVVGG